LTNDDIARLYGMHAESLLAYFARRTLQAETAVDLMAETFAAAFEDRSEFRGQGEDQALAWIYGIAHHQLASYFRRGEVERRALQRMDVQIRPLRDHEHDEIERLAGLSDLREQIEDGLASLGDDQREALRLRVLEDLAYPEVARALGITEQTARARVSRGLVALRRSRTFSDLRQSADHA
jgi:RNA polymerase sigma-70 factor (ECF subfamily)